MPLARRPNDRLAQIINSPLFIPVCLLAITLLGTFLRLYRLGEWSFWGDEMFTVGGQEDGFNYSLLRQSLSLMLVQIFTTANGVNEWNARIIPAVIGILSIPILYWGVKKAVNTPTALLFSLLLALSPWHLYWSQNARFYVALLLFYSLALLFFYLGTEQDNPWYLVASLLFLGLAVKERLLALFFLPVILTYLLLLPGLSFQKPKGWRLRNLMILLLPCLVGGLLFAGPYLLNLSGWLTGFGFANNSPFWLAGGFAYYVGLPVICLAGLGGIYLLQQKSRGGLLLCVSAIVPPLLLVMISPFHYTANRYGFISLTSWLLLAAISLVLLIKKTFGSGNILALGSLLILLVSFISEDGLYFLNQNGNRENWKAAFAYVREHQQPGDAVYSGDDQLANFYLSEPTLHINQLDLESLSSLSARTWFVEDAKSALQYNDVHVWLAENARLVSINDVYFQTRNYSMRVYLFDPVSSQSMGVTEYAK